MSGPLTHSPADVIQQLLIDLELGTAVADEGAWPVYASRLPDTPDPAIAAIDTVGKKQGRTMIDGEVQENPGVQILIRAASSTTGWTKARAIAVALDEEVNLDYVTIDGSVYLVYNVSRTSGPMALGKDVPNSKRNLFSVNATVTLRQTT